MSGAYAIITKERGFDLHEDDDQRRVRALMLPIIYALADEDGWDAKRMTAAQRALLPSLKPSFQPWIANGEVR